MAEDLAHNFLSQVFAKHGTPTDIVSNRGSTSSHAFGYHFASCSASRQSLNSLSPRDRRARPNEFNQILEQYLWIYINYQQDDWVDFLPLAEFRIQQYFAFGHHGHPRMHPCLEWSPISFFPMAHKALFLALSLATCLYPLPFSLPTLPLVLFSGLKAQALKSQSGNAPKQAHSICLGTAGAQSTDVQPSRINRAKEKSRAKDSAPGW